MAVIGRIVYDATPMRQLVRGLFLALVLLLAQQGLLLHQLSHYAAAATQSDGDDGRHVDAGPCVTCVAFAELGAAAAPEVAPQVQLDRLAFWCRAALALPRHSLEALPQRNRGPPTFL
jgi:hypothetical protein